MSSTDNFDHLLKSINKIQRKINNKTLNYDNKKIDELNNDVVQLRKAINLYRKSSTNNIEDKPSNKKSDFYYKTIIEKSGLIYYYYKIDKEKVTWEGAIEKILGYSNEEFNNVGVDEYIKLIHPDDRHWFLLEHNDARKSLKEYSVGYRLHCKNGSYSYILDNGVYIKDKDEGLLMIGILTDVTKQKKAEKLLQVKERTSSLLKDIFIASNEVECVDDLLKRTMKIISIYTGWPLSRSIMLTDLKYNFKLPSSISYSLTPERYNKIINLFNKDKNNKLSESHLKVITSKRAIWVNNIEKQKDLLFKDEILNAGFHHLIIFPITISDKVIGLIEFYAHYLEISDELMPELMEQIGMQLGIIVEHKITEQQLKKLFLAIEQNYASIVITDSDGYIEYVNPKFSENTGYSVEEVLGKKPSILKSGIHDKQFYFYFYIYLLFFLQVQVLSFHQGSRYLLGNDSLS